MQISDKVKKVASAVLILTGLLFIYIAIRILQLGVAVPNPTFILYSTMTLFFIFLIGNAFFGLGSILVGLKLDYALGLYNDFPALPMLKNLPVKLAFWIAVMLFFDAIYLEFFFKAL